MSVFCKRLTIAATSIPEGTDDAIRSEMRAILPSFAKKVVEAEDRGAAIDVLRDVDQLQTALLRRGRPGPESDMRVRSSAHLLDHEVSSVFRISHGRLTYAKSVLRQLN